MTKHVIFNVCKSFVWLTSAWKWKRQKILSSIHSAEAGQMICCNSISCHNNLLVWIDSTVFGSRPCMVYWHSASRLKANYRKNQSSLQRPEPWAQSPPPKKIIGKRIKNGVSLLKRVLSHKNELFLFEERIFPFHKGCCIQKISTSYICTGFFHHHRLQSPSHLEPIVSFNLIGPFETISFT